MAVPLKLTFDPSLLQQLDDWQASIQSDALVCIQSTLPRKILSLNAQIRAFDEPNSTFALRTYLANDAQLSDLDIHPASTSTSAALAQPSKKRKVSTETSLEDQSATDDTLNEDDEHIFRAKIGGCETMNKIHERLREEWHELIVNMDIVKMWVNLLFPKIEDGDTFGQSVQEEVLNEIIRSQELGCNFLSTPYTYASTRAELCAKRIRFPGVADYVTSLQEHDRKAFYRARTQYTDLRNIYAVVLDLIRKNIEKISKPKSGNRE